MPNKSLMRTAVFVFIILVLGLAATWFTWNLTAHQLSEQALEQARIVAQSMNQTRLASLMGDEKDLTSPDYLRIKDQLRRIRTAHRTCRFLYIMGQKEDGTVFFFVDSQDENSKDYARPGLVYTEVSEEYLYTFQTGQQRTVGPIKDRWGTLVTSLIPIYNSDKSNLIAVLGMDIDAGDWKKQIISHCLLPVSLTGFIILLAIFLFILYRDKQLIHEHYLEKNKLAAELQESLQHVKRLQGLLPICASCKRIRDDQGYWNQLEAYIEKHSEAQFSHGICDECAEKLYHVDKIDDQKQNAES